MTESLRVGVIGTGYLGTTHAAGMTEMGHQVVGLDVDAEKVAQLSAGQVPFFEPGLPEMLARGLSSGRLRFTTSFADVAASADITSSASGRRNRSATTPPTCASWTPLPDLLPPN